jgi:preprotein translocase subunit SecE
MGHEYKKKLNSKREALTYIVIILWIYMGSIAIYFGTDLSDLSVYFLSLTGFIMSYIFGESVRKSSDNSIFLKGKNSKRELLTYSIILIWLIIGSFIIINGGDLIGAATYFGTLTPFVGAYIIGETYKKDPEYEEESYEDESYENLDVENIEEENSENN